MASATTELVNREAVASSGSRVIERRRLRWFFPALSAVLLALVAAAFAPTFFLRGRLTPPGQPLPPLTPFLVVHGAVMTAWFTLAFVQTCLIAGHRKDWHRRLGMATAGVAVLLVPMNAWVVVHAVPNMISYNLPRAQWYGVIVGDLVALLFFCTFVGIGFYYRQRRTDIHKRFMAFASLTLIGPVWSRLDIAYGVRVPPFVVPLAAIVAFGTYDVFTRRRIHAATVWVTVIAQIVGILIMGALIRSGAADAIIDALR